MYNIIQKATNFKIIPNNFKSSGAFKVIETNAENFEVELTLIDDREIQDYTVGSTVEVFGVYEIGLIYFETKILNKSENRLTLALTPDYSIIQRREYSRVGLNQGSVTFKDLEPDLIKSVEDISAGGVKFISTKALELDKHYAIEITLSNNMKIECSLAPIRIVEKEDKTYEISGKFVDLENVDRIVLVQYAFKIKMEEQNKETN